MSPSPERSSDPSATRDDLVSRHAGPFRISLSEHRADTAIDAHAHAAAIVHIVLDGLYCEQIGRRRLSLGHDTVLFKRPLEEHANRFGPATARTIRIVLPTDDDLPLPSRFRDTFALRHASARAVGRRMALECRTHDASSPLVLEGLCWSLLGELGRTRARRGTDALVAAAADVLRQRFRESLRMHTVAETLGIPPATLANAFRQRYGMSMGAFVREQRLLDLAEGLRTTDRPICDLALDAGFADQSHATRAFRARFGTTPARYRRDG